MTDLQNPKYIDIDVLCPNCGSPKFLRYSELSDEQRIVSARFTTGERDKLAEQNEEIVYCSRCLRTVRRRGTNT